MSPPPGSPPGSLHPKSRLSNPSRSGTVLTGISQGLSVTHRLPQPSAPPSTSEASTSPHGSDHGVLTSTSTATSCTDPPSSPGPPGPHVSLGASGHPRSPTPRSPHQQPQELDSVLTPALSPGAPDAPACGFPTLSPSVTPGSRCAQPCPRSPVPRPQQTPLGALGSPADSEPLRARCHHK